MKIFKIKRKDSCDYDEWDAAVVVAENEEKAILVDISTWSKLPDYWNKENLIIECIGTTDTEEEGLILASFNAG